MGETIKHARLLMKDHDPYVLFSGGKDSLVALHITKLIAEELGGRVSAIHVDTTVATPGNLDYVKETCRELNVQLVTLKPKTDYFTLVEKWGFPVLTRRWCKRYLKIFPVRDYLNTIRRDDVVLVDGVRAQESWMKRTARNQQVLTPWLTHHEILKCKVLHPVYDWSLIDINRYIEEHGLKENPLYKTYGKAFDCWCTVFKSPADMVVLSIKNPDFFHRLVELEATQRNGGSAMFDRSRSQRIYLRDIEAHPERYVTYDCSHPCACMTL